MAKERKNRTDKTIDALGWAAIAAVLFAAMVLDKDAPPHKWHAAIVWTGVAFYGALVFGRQFWRSWQFWLLWLAFLTAHVVLMWLIFAQLLPRLILGTLYVIPLGFVEGVLVVGAIARVRRKIAVLGSSY